MLLEKRGGEGRGAAPRVAVEWGMKILQSLVVCEEYGAAEKFFPDFPAPREGALRYKCLYLYKAARKAEVFAGWRYMCV